MSPISIDSFSWVMVVEYLESSMSTDLLGKFPDNSAFDFNYAQSSIWSPLLPRPPQSSAAAGRLELSRRLSYGENGGLLENTKKIAAKIKRKFTDALLGNIRACSKMKRRKRKSFGLTQAGSGRRLSSSSPSPKLQEWAKVMKSAAKKFKRRQKKTKDQSVVHLHLTS